MMFLSDQNTGVTLINSDFQLYGLPTIEDNNSFLHAVSGCAIPEYRLLLWDDSGRIIMKNIDKLSIVIKNLRKDLLSVFETNNYMDAKNCIKYLTDLFVSENYLNNQNGRERLITRLFNIYTVLGTEQVNSTGEVSGWYPPIGLKNGYFYRTDKLKYKLVNYSTDIDFNPLLHLSLKDQKNLYDEFKDLDINDPKNILIPDIALRQYYYHQDTEKLYRPSTLGVFNLGMNGNLCLFINEKVSFKNLIEFFLEQDTEFTDWSIRLTMYALDLNLVLLKGTEKIKYECSSPSKPWIIITEENGIYYTTGIERYGNLLTVFNQDDGIIQTLVDTTGIDILLNIDSFNLKMLKLNDTT